MKIINRISELQHEIAVIRKANGKVGFVPTMGALHQGHLDLVKRCVAENDCCVVSIFVNPTQFNDQNDLLKYPRTLEKDCELLASVGCKLVFAPSVDEIYPEQDNRIFDFGSLDKVMEGEFRPGHFNGVAQVVSRLFDVVQPDSSYFGEKDFQQLAIIRVMAKQLGLSVKINAHPIVRHQDGLAMSSRNMRLTEQQRANAPFIWKTLSQSRDFASTRSIAQTRDFVVDTINSNPDLKVEYFDIVDGETLQPVNNWSESNYIVGCIAVFCGEVRLIDNIIYSCISNKE